MENKHRVEKQNRAVERDRENAHNEKVNYNNIRRIATQRRAEPAQTTGTSKKFSGNRLDPDYRSSHALTNH